LWFSLDDASGLVGPGRATNAKLLLGGVVAWLVGAGVVATALWATATWLGLNTGAALLRSRASRTSRLQLLGSATAFGWRLTSGVLLAWTLTLAISSLVFGLMVSAIVDFIAEDDTYRRLLESMGMDMSVPVIGFLSYIALFLALPLTIYVGFRMGAVRQEEADGRLDNLLVRGVERRRWLVITAVQALLAATILVVACGSGLWAGAQLVDARVTVLQVTKPLAGRCPSSHSSPVSRCWRSVSHPGSPSHCR
jgi:ABC-2 type transport system permease protein